MKDSYIEKMLTDRLILRTFEKQNQAILPENSLNLLGLYSQNWEKMPKAILHTDPGPVFGFQASEKEQEEQLP